MRHLRFVSVCAVICVALTLGSSRTATPKSDYNELLNGAKVVWDSVLIQSDSPCWPDARDAVVRFRLLVAIPGFWQAQ